MWSIDFIYDLILRKACPRTEHVITHQEGEKLFLKVYASNKITVHELQTIINTYKLFNITLEFIRYEKMPFNDCLILFEVRENEWYYKYDW